MITKFGLGWRQVDHEERRGWQTGKMRDHGKLSRMAKIDHEEDGRNNDTTAQHQETGQPPIGVPEPEGSC